MILRTIPTGMLHTNCYLVGDEASGVCAVFDPGAHTEKVLNMIAESGLTCKYIILTHCHFDHVMAAPFVQEATGAELMIHELDAPFLTPEYVNRRGYIRETYRAPRVDRLLRDGDEIDVGSIKMKVTLTPGHTLGSCVFTFGDVMIAGDTLFKDACGRWDMMGGSMDDMMHSLKKLHDMEGDYRVLCGHGDPTTLEEERQHNPYMRMALEKLK